MIYSYHFRRPFFQVSKKHASVLLFQLGARHFTYSPSIDFKQSPKISNRAILQQLDKEEYLSLTSIEKVVHKALHFPKFIVNYPTVSFCLNFLKATDEAATFSVSKCITLFRFIDKFDIILDESFFVFALGLCVKYKDAQSGEFFKMKLKSYSIPDYTKILTRLIDLYVKCGEEEKAYQLYKEMEEKYKIKPDIFHVTCVIGYLIKKFTIEEVLEIIIPYLKTKGNEDMTWTVLLHSCSELNDVNKSRKLYQFMIEYGVPFSDFLVTSAIDMFAKIGEIDQAKIIFEKFENKISESNGLFSVNSMINAYGNHSLGKEAVDLFYKYSNIVKHDDVSFVCILNACSHSGLIEEAMKIFNSMERVYNVTPNLKHKTCIVDCLSRIEGNLEEAETRIKNDPELIKYKIAWAALLGGCRKFGDVKRAERILNEHMFALEIPSDQLVGYQVLMGNIYAAAGKHDENSNLRNEITSPKKPGQSWMILNGEKVIFTVGLSIEKSLIRKAESQGYKTDITWALKGNTKEEKIESLCGHSEKRLLEYALKSTPEYSKVTIFKNLRICGDCHSFSEAISKETKRVIAIRDANLFHTFDPIHGCSCKGHF